MCLAETRTIVNFLDTFIHSAHNFPEKLSDTTCAALEMLVYDLTAVYRGLSARHIII
jgi:hypothetical protein